jgi:hypothetical protein
VEEVIIQENSGGQIIAVIAPHETGVQLTNLSVNDSIKPRI